MAWKCRLCADRVFDRQSRAGTENKLMLQVGKRFGEYEILDMIESSRKEVLFKVRNHAAHRIEAMKVLSDRRQQDLEAVERFLREIRLHAKLSHPNILAFYGAAQIDGIPFLTTEYVECVTLASKIERGPLPLHLAVSYLKQVLAALDHAHSRDILHREVTPDNILILHDGTVKLGGFGLAKAKGDLSLTQVGTLVGEVAYMSPEQVKGRADIDFRTDVYSAGAVFFECVTGRKPFHAASDFDMMLAHVQREVPLVASVNRSLPTSLDSVIQRALAKKASDRYLSAAAFSEALNEYADPAFPSGAAAVASPQHVLPAMGRPEAERMPVAAVVLPPRGERIAMAFLIVTLVLIASWSLLLFVRG